MDLDETKNLIKDNKYHIYVVCKREKLYFERSKVEGDFCKTTLHYLNDKRDKEYLRYKHPNDLIINGFEDG